MRILRFVLGLFILLIVLAVIAVGVGFYLLREFDPNSLKTQLEQTAFEQTGLSLAVNGDISWQFWPSIRLALNSIKIDTPEAFNGDTELLSIGQAMVSVSATNLIDQKITVEELQIQKMGLRLAENSKGQLNLDQALSGIQQNSQPNSASQSVNHGATTEEQNITIENIGIVLVSLKDISIVDERNDADTSLHLKALQLENVKLNGENFPLSMTGALSSGSNKSSAQPLTSFSINGNLGIDLKANRFGLEQLSGNIQLGGAQQATQLNGSADLSIDEQIKLTSILSLDTIDLRDFISAQENTQTENTSDISTPIPLSDQPLNLQLPKNISASLNWQVGKILYPGSVKSPHKPVEITNAKLKGSLSQGVLAIKQLSGEAFGGQIQLTANLKTQGQKLQAKTTQTLSNINVAKLLDSRGVEISLQGRANMQSSLNIAGNSTAELSQSLNGSTKLQWINGFYGDDNLEYRVCQAVSQVRRKSLGDVWGAPPSFGGTQFNELNSTINWKNGVGTIAALNGGLNTLKLKGDGVINSLQQKFDLRIAATITGDIQDKDPACAVNENYRDIAWPIRCRGTADDSSCSIDNSRFDKLLGKIAKAEAKRAIQKELFKALGGSSKNASETKKQTTETDNVKTSESEEEPKDIEDVLKDAVKERLGNDLGGILEGIFR